MRQERDLSLDELAKISGVSKSLLVKIEHGNGNPSLSTLWKIANSMMVPFDTLVSTPRSAYEIVKISECDPIIEDQINLQNYVLFPGDDHQRFSVYYLEVQPGYQWSAEMHMRGTVEFITVFSGVLSLTVGGETFILNPKESIRFKADVPHNYHNISDEILCFHNILFNP